jgi:P-type Ca2+ transporter type 2C
MIFFRESRIGVGIQLISDNESNCSKEEKEVDCVLSQLSNDELFRVLDVEFPQGLTSDDAALRLSRKGPNTVVSKPRSGAIKLLIRQFQSSVVILLIVAAGISILTDEFLQAVGIFCAVLINALVGFITELKAQISLEALNRITGPSSRVIRDGTEMTVSSELLVPGDLVILEQGSRVPADLRIIDSVRLKIDESVLTGESVPADKSGDCVDSPHSQSNIAYHGTHVLEGRGRAIVIETGAETTLGKLQCALYDGHAIPTPLEIRLDELGRHLTWMTVFICLAIALIGLMKGHDIWSMLETSIALAVAAIPEGLPVVATLALAIGTQRMVRSGALIRKLSAVETLGCTTVICSDKTGTLTENKLQIISLYMNKQFYSVTGDGYSPVGAISYENGENAEHEPEVIALSEVAALCNDARLVHSDDLSAWSVIGDPTEGALLTLAAKVGLSRDDVEVNYPRFGEIPFDLNSKLMYTIHRTNEKKTLICVKGSPEAVLEHSNSVISAELNNAPLDASLKAHYIDVAESMAEKGLRVLGLARAFHSGDEAASFDYSESIDDLTFLGLVAMRDSPRKNVKDAISQCKEAGIRIIMVTGDHPATACNIARELQIIDSDLEALALGSEFESSNDEKRKELLGKVAVMARVRPTAKLSVVKSLQENKQIVAMTGDGVNDAPALQQADIGVAMGGIGTDLAREASNMVITDDNFATIVSAIKQGRIIYDNIKRAVCYLLTASVASVLTIAFAIVYDGTLALLPLQLLWLNLVMHIFPGLGIVLQEAAPGIMSRPPRKPNEPLIGRREWMQISMQSIIVAIAVVIAGALQRNMYGSAENSSSIYFMTISLALLFQAWCWLFLDETGKIAFKGVRINFFMVSMMLVSYMLVFIALYTPVLTEILQTRPLSLPELILVLIAATASFCSILTVNILLGLRNSSNSSNSLNSTESI